MKNKDNHKMHLDLLNVISHLEENSITILITKKYNSIKKKKKKKASKIWLRFPDYLSVWIHSPKNMLRGRQWYEMINTDN